MVFCLIDGRPLHPDRLTQMFRERCRASGLPYITLHGLRHSHASQMLRAGVHPKVVQERLGHSSISMTLDIYSHAIPAMQEDAAERTAALIDTPDLDDGLELS
jgi:integrase